MINPHELTLFIILMVLAYINIGLLYSVTTIRFITGKDTWDNLLEHKGLFIKYTLFWLFYAIKDLRG